MIDRVRADETLEQRLDDGEFLGAGDDLRVEIGGFRAVADVQNLRAVALGDVGFPAFAAGQQDAEGEREEDESGARTVWSWHHAGDDGPARVRCKRQICRWVVGGV